MKKLWVVEAQFKGGGWDVANFTGDEYVSTNYYQAHRMKRAIQNYAYKYGSKHWTKNKFRVKEYIPVEKYKHDITKCDNKISKTN